ncbi:hypothetical protein EXU48_05740 [Occultella glacieicola]|uniref:ABC transporter permease n=1 Tax=Occultella glacieicola TaxID=2518684 RepID=A0ABY2E595_9MICO|nr:DUF6297 family protein [Occultella glacieicola]TDE95767.1 hypothetical protein EXU48_05740 [Occultella glacieicola]
MSTTDADETRPVEDPRGDDDAWPNGRQLRSLTRDATDAHTGGSYFEVISEVYSVVFSAAIALAIALGAVQGLNATLTPGPEVHTLDPTWLAVVTTLIVAGAIVGLAGRIGPVGMGGGQAVWWLPTPADRRGLLRPRSVLVPIMGAAVGAAGGLLIGFLALGEPGPALGSIVVLSTLGGAALALAAAAGQVQLGNKRARRVRPAALIGDILMAAGPVLGLAVVFVRPPPLMMPTGTVAVVAIAVLAVLVVALLVRVDTGLNAISGRELRARGAVSAYAAGAVTSMDTRELGRALSGSTAPDQRRRSARMAWVRGPVSAIVTGDALVLSRSPRHLIQIVVAASLALMALLAGWPTWVNVTTLLLGGYLAAMATAESARRAEMAPVLDRFFPISAFDVRRVRIILPGVIMVLWSAGVFAVWGATHGNLPGWIALGVIAAPTFAAGVVRAAYRKPPDWTKPLVTGPMGPVPPGVLLAFARGPDLVVICLIPTLIALIAFGPTFVLVWLQAATSAIAFAIATHVKDEKKPSMMERATEAQKAAGPR